MGSRAITMTIELVLIALSSLIITGSGVALYGLYYDPRIFFGKEHAAGDVVLPATVQERRRLMQEQGDNGEIAQKIKLASRANVMGPQEFYVKKLLRRAGRIDDTSLNEVATRAIWYFCAGILGGGILGATMGLVLPFAALGSLIGPIAPLQELIISGRIRERQFMLAIAGLIRPLMITLDRGLDLTTTLKELVARAEGGTVSDQVVSLFEQGLAIARNCETDARSVLKELSFVTGSPSFSRLCHLLSLSATHAAGWRMQLEDFAADLDDKISVESKFKPNPQTSSSKAAPALDRFIPDKSTRTRG